MLDLIFAAGLCVAVDGDTLRCGEHRIRLHGIDAADFNCNGRGDWCREDRKAAESARRHLAAMIEGRAIRCDRKDRDRYNRTVAVCFLGDIVAWFDGQPQGPKSFRPQGGPAINCLMIQSGHAIEWVEYSRGMWWGCAP
jgi:endonuclease YncB( thermonuclease family)